MSLLLALAALQDVDVLLRGLGDEDPAVRERSAAVLLERWERWSEADLAALRKGTESSDQEVAGRVKTVLAAVGRRRRLGADLLAQVPDLERTIASGTAEDRTALLVDLRRRWRLGEIDSARARAVAELLVEAGFTLPEDADIVDEPFRPYAPLLPPLLKHPARRAEGIERIAQHRAREYAPLVVALLDDPDEKVRAQAVRALDGWDRPEATAAALRLLDAEDARSLGVALDVLHRRPADAPLERLRALQGRPEAFVRAGVLDVLSATGRKDLLPEIAAGLRDKEIHVRVEAARALARLGAKEHAPAILGLLREVGKGHEDDVWSALEDLGLDAVRGDIVAMSEGGEGPGRWRAWELRLKRDPDAPLADLKHENADRRAWAARALGWRRRPADAPAFAALLKDASPDVREAAIEGLAGAGAVDRAEAVAALLSDPDKRVRMTAAEVLARLDGHAFADRLLALLKDTEDWPRHAALRSLGWLGAREHAGAVVERLRADSARAPDLELRVLAEMGAVDRIQAVRDALKADRPDQAAAVRALAALGGTAEELLPSLQSEDEDRFQAARDVLAPLATEAVVRALEANLETPRRFEAAIGLLETGRTDVLARVLQAYAAPELGQERLWLAWRLARWTARGVEPPDGAAFVRVLDRMGEEIHASFRDAALLAKVGLGVVPPTAYAEAFDRTQEEDLFPVLCRVHLKDAYPKVYRRFTLAKDVRSARDVEAELARQWGLKVRIDDTLFFTGRVPAGRATSGVELFGRLSHRYVEHRSFIDVPGTYVEDGVLRVGLSGDARAAWRRTLGLK